MIAAAALELALSDVREAERKVDDARDLLFRASRTLASLKHPAEAAVDKARDQLYDASRQIAGVCSLPTATQACNELRGELVKQGLATPAPTVAEQVVEALKGPAGDEMREALKKVSTPRRVSVEFNDSEYRFSHGAAPRGRGSWAFIFSLGALPKDYTNESVWFTPGATTFAEAKKLAKLEAARRFPGAGHVTVGVCS